MTTLQQQIAAKQQEADSALNAWRSRADAKDQAGAAAAKEAFTLANTELSDLSAKRAKEEAAEVAEAEQLAAAERDFRKPDDSKRIPKQPERNPEQAAEKFRKVQEAALRTYCVDGARSAVNYAAAAGLGPDQIATLVSWDNTKGGYLIKEDKRDEVLADLPGASVFRSLCRVERTDSTMLAWPAVASATSEAHTRTSTLTADVWALDGEAASTQDMTFAEVQIPVHPMVPPLVVVGAQTMDAANPEQIIMEQLFQNMEADLDKAVLRGNGSKRPLGIMETSGITEVVTQDADEITFPGLLNLIYTLPAQWRTGASICMRSLTYAAMLNIEDGAGNKIITPNTTPERLLGYPVVFSEWMPAIAASAYPIVFGNFKYYVIAEQATLRVQRIDQTYFPNVAFGAYQARGGAVIRPAAFVKQKVSAS